MIVLRKKGRYIMDEKEELEKWNNDRLREQEEKLGFDLESIDYEEEEKRSKKLGKRMKRLEKIFRIFSIIIYAVVIIGVIIFTISMYESAKRKWGI